MGSSEVWQAAFTPSAGHGCKHSVFILHVHKVHNSNMSFKATKNQTLPVMAGLHSHITPLPALAFTASDRLCNCTLLLSCILCQGATWRHFENLTYCSRVAAATLYDTNCTMQLCILASIWLCCLQGSQCLRLLQWAAKVRGTATLTHLYHYPKHKQSRGLCNVCCWSGPRHSRCCSALVVMRSAGHRNKCPHAHFVQPPLGMNHIQWL